MVLTKEMVIKKVEFIVEGRKVPLKEIRTKTLAEHAQYMRDQPDEYYDSMTPQQVIDRLKELNEYEENDKLSNEDLKENLKSFERQRHLLMWHDNSAVANHGYLVCLAAVLYDPTIFLTNNEYKVKTGKTVDIQTIIEKPHVHFIAHCSSSEAEQISYIETRLSCIQNTAQNLESANANEILDICRCFKGDSPSRQFEIGQQKGGHYFCYCDCHASRVDELDHVMSCLLMSLQERVNAMMKPGTVSRMNTLLHRAKPLADLTKEQLEKELAARGIFVGKRKQDLHHLLNSEMRGMQRVPALLVNNPHRPVRDLCLDKYEVLPVEPLHDIGHHIENVFTELPHHLNTKEKNAFQESVALCLGEKESKRGVDYRAALIKITAYLKQKSLISEKPLQLLSTLTEMQRILYCPDEKRCPQLILRYYNQTWYHAILLKQLVKEAKKLTTRKLFGVYFHDLTAHGGLMLRIISGQSANAEEEERIFHHIKGITKKTSNYSNTQLVPNLFLCLQAEKEMGVQECVERQQHYISTLAKSLPPLKNTHIPIATIKKHPREWQAHLMQISDFLIEGEGIWWKKEYEAIEFHDISNNPSPSDAGPRLHHFRSSSLSKEVTHLKQCWNKCLEDIPSLPTHIIRVDQEDGSTKIIRTTNLGDMPSTPTGNITSQSSAGPSLDKHILDDLDAAANDLTAHTKTEVHFSENTHGKETADNLNIDDENVNEDEVLVQAADVFIDVSEADLDGQYSHNPLTSLIISTPTEAEQQRSNTENPTEHPEIDRTVQVHYTLQTCLGKVVEIVLSQTPAVEKLDKKHHELKLMKKNEGMISKQAEESYKNVLAPIQVQVLAQKAKSEKQLASWEKQYYLDNNLNSPTYEIMKADKEASVLLTQIKYAQALLNEWDISF